MHFPKLKEMHYKLLKRRLEMGWKTMRIYYFLLEIIKWFTKYAFKDTHKKKIQ